MANQIFCFQIKRTPRRVRAILLVFEKFTRAYLFKIALEIMYNLYKPVQNDTKKCRLETWTPNSRKDLVFPKYTSFLLIRLQHTDPYLLTSL